ncbi:MAG: Hsp20 family protein [Candidatus Aenigmarchaeota archaeon]|nr:Hsp20 family protein [Candidatus Aenigmarchaeota archaeon]
MTGMKETEKELAVSMEIPGAKEDDIRIHLTEKELKVQAESGEESKIRRRGTLGKKNLTKVSTGR